MSIFVWTLDYSQNYHGLVLHSVCFAAPFQGYFCFSRNCAHLKKDAYIMELLHLKEGKFD